MVERRLVSACFFTIGTAIATALVLYPLVERHYNKALASELRRQNQSENFREIDGAEVLKYILHESTWGWRKYARLNCWAMVEGHEFNELQRAAKSGDVRLKGQSSVSGETEVIDRRFWLKNKFSNLVSHTYGLSSDQDPNYPSKRYYHIAASNDDMHQTWPKASIIRRALTSLFVRKKLILYRFLPAKTLDRLGW